MSINSQRFTLAKRTFLACRGDGNGYSQYRSPLFIDRINRGTSPVLPDVILMAITSQLRDPPAVGEVRISHWQSAGLLKDSAIKPVIFTAEKSIVRKTLGQLAESDQLRLAESLQSILSR